MNRLNQYIKVAHNVVMTRFTAWRAGHIDLSDERTDLTDRSTPITPASVTADASVSKKPQPATTPEIAERRPLSESQLADRLDDMLAVSNPRLLSPEKQEKLIEGGAQTVKILRNYELATGREVLPTTKVKTEEQRRQDIYDAASPELKRVLMNSGYINPPISAEVKRILAVTQPSLLSPEDQQSLLPARTVEMLQNHKLASGESLLPVDKARDEKIARERELLK
jgi:hypothetical protein